VFETGHAEDGDVRYGEQGSFDGFGMRAGDGQVGERKRGKKQARELDEVVGEGRDLSRGRI
jgi:hypothetical protein